MKTRLKFLSVTLGGLFLLSSVFISGCGETSKTTRPQKGGLDTPEFHVSRGDDALNAGYYQRARASYKSALSLQKENPEALSGVAVSNAYLIDRPGVSDQGKQIVFEEGIEMLEKALEQVSSDDKSVFVKVQTNAVQFYYVLKLPVETWTEKIAEHYEAAIEVDPGNPLPYYFMAQANAHQHKYDEAISQLKKVLIIGGKYESEANREITRIQTIQRALPGSRFGKNIANIREITRADLAALFVTELRLDRLYGDQKQSSSSATYQAPKAQRKLSSDPIAQYPDAVDIKGHPMEQTIKEVMAMGIKGLESNPAHQFLPDQKITRAEFALMIQDIIVKVTRNHTLETQFFGQPSPFPDVSESVWYYNAARTVVSRGLMQIRDRVNGKFQPLAPVSGAEALLTVRNLKDLLKQYLR